LYLDEVDAVTAFVGMADRSRARDDGDGLIVVRWRGRRMDTEYVVTGSVERRSGRALQREKRNTKLLLDDSGENTHAAPD
jgi:hypothetical protein